MNLLLHPDSDNRLSEHYQRAFNQANELFIVTAYLTEWDETLKLNPDCHSFRIIIGKDFGITRKVACETVMKWLPSERKGQFMVADMISGFHPKAVFWKELNGGCFAIIGSSNLTRAAFETNFEVNVFSKISDDEYAKAKMWVKSIENLAVTVSEDWLEQYKEAIASGKKTGKPTQKKNEQETGVPLIPLVLPIPAQSKEYIKRRRNQLAEYKKHRAGLIDLFKRCANGDIDSNKFFEELPHHWSHDINDRIQGAGWERLGKDSNFKLLSQSYLKIINATDDDRDDVVVMEIDYLKMRGVATRGAFLSEMLCLEFPQKYPVLDKPVKDFIKAIKFKAPKGASQGVRYIDLAKKLRVSLLQNSNHPAKDLAELDTVLWLAFGKR